MTAAKLMIRVVRDENVSGSDLLSLTEVAYLSRLHPELITRFVTLGLLEPRKRLATGELLFDTEAVLTARKIWRLRHELGINYAGIGLVLDLLDRIEVLENEVNHLKKLLDADSYIDI